MLSALNILGAEEPQVVQASVSREAPSAPILPCSVNPGSAPLSTPTPEGVSGAKTAHTHAPLPLPWPGAVRSIPQLSAPDPRRSSKTGTSHRRRWQRNVCPRAARRKATAAASAQPVPTGNARARTRLTRSPSFYALLLNTLSLVHLKGAKAAVAPHWLTTRGLLWAHTVVDITLL